MWNLQSEQNGKRLYVNSVTGGKCSTSKVFTDNQGNDWYGFDDLFTIPFTRNFAASKVSSLYALGFTKPDLDSFSSSMKVILKSNDTEKYEKAYSLLLDFEGKVDNATEPIKQITGLTCVYFMLSDELIDAFENNLQIRKLSILESDPMAQSFFFSSLIPVIEDYMNRLNTASKIVLTKSPASPEVLQ